MPILVPLFRFVQRSRGDVGARPVAAGLLMAAVGAGCASQRTPPPRRGDDAVVWAVKDQFEQFRPSAWQHEREWWQEALAGEVPTSFAPTDQAAESFEKMHRAWYGP